jgi:3-mercaptopyruvate sulfurtransferase SseA
MPKFKILIVLSLLLLTALACNTLPPAAEPTSTFVVILEPTAPTGTSTLPANEAEVPRLSLEGARAALESGTAIVVDVRSAEAYAASHIPGAINIPLNEFESNPGGLNLDREQWIITYCT